MTVRINENLRQNHHIGPNPDGFASFSTWVNSNKVANLVTDPNE
jgi:hypothetical protein